MGKIGTCTSFESVTVILKTCAGSPLSHISHCVFITHTEVRVIYSSFLVLFFHMFMINRALLSHAMAFTFSRKEGNCRGFSGLNQTCLDKRSYDARILSWEKNCSVFIVCYGKPIQRLIMKRTLVYFVADSKTEAVKLISPGVNVRLIYTCIFHCQMLKINVHVFAKWYKGTLSK